MLLALNDNCFGEINSVAVLLAWFLNRGPKYVGGVKINP